MPATGYPWRFLAPKGPSSALGEWSLDPAVRQEQVEFGDQTLPTVGSVGVTTLESTQVTLPAWAEVDSDFERLNHFLSDEGEPRRRARTRHSRQRERRAIRPKRDGQPL